MEQCKAGRTYPFVSSIPQQKDRKAEGRPVVGELQITLQGLSRGFVANATMIMGTRKAPICSARQEELCSLRPFQVFGTGETWGRGPE